jgi:hypothetical protein
MKSLAIRFWKLRIVFMLIKMLFFFSVSLAQQGVAITNDGSSPAPSAILDIKSNNKGILIPRLTGSQRSSIVSPAMGLLVYQTDASPGFYYFNGSAWMSLATGQGAGNGWSLTGNAGMDSTVNFIGTTDQKPFIGKVNGEKALHFSPTLPVTTFANQAGKNNTNGNQTFRLQSGNV